MFSTHALVTNYFQIPAKLGFYWEPESPSGSLGYPETETSLEIPVTEHK